MNYNNKKKRERKHKHQTSFTQWDTKRKHYEETSPGAPLLYNTVEPGEDGSSSHGEKWRLGPSFPLPALRTTSSAYGRAAIASWSRLRTVPHEISKSHASPTALAEVPLPTVHSLPVLGEYVLRVAVRIDFMNVWPIHSSLAMKVSLFCCLSLVFFWGEEERVHPRSVATSSES